MRLKIRAKDVPILVLGVILIIIAYQIYDLNERFGIQKISVVDWSTENFNVSGNIIAERRAEYIFPTDSLRYQLTWKNKINDPLEITPHLVGMVGEQNSFLQPKEFNTFFVSTDKPVVTIHEFTLDKEGQHSIKYVFQVVNQTDMNNLETITIPNKIEILSRSDQLQQDSNQWSLLGVIISASIAGGAAFTTAYEMRRSRVEKQNTTRAMIGLESQQMNILSYIDVNGNEKTENEIKIMNTQNQGFDWIKIRRSFELKNYGQLPALDVKSRSKIVSGKEPELNEINSLDFGTGAMIFPNGTQPFIFEFTKEMEDKMDSSTGNTYYLFETEYTSTNSKKIRKMGLLLKLGLGHYTIAKNWDESNLP